MSSLIEVYCPCCGTKQEVDKGFECDISEGTVHKFQIKCVNCNTRSTVRSY